MSSNKPPIKKITLKRVVKYFAFAISAGVIQIISFTILTEANVFGDMENPYGPSYFIALVLSVLWNFTFNRRYTFRSVANIPLAMMKVIGYYLIFTPLSIWWGVALTNGDESHWIYYAVLIGTMLINGITEFLFYHFFVFGRTIDTNSVAKRQLAREKAKIEPDDDSEVAESE